MARAALSTEPSRVYVGMLIVTALAMAVGVTCMVLEAGEYDWESKPGATLKVDLPKEPAAPAGNAAAPVEPKAETKTESAAKPLPVFATPPAVMPVVPQTLPPIAPLPATVAETKPEPKPEVKPEPASAPAKPPVPFPNPLLIPPGR